MATGVWVSARRPGDTARMASADSKDGTAEPVAGPPGPRTSPPLTRSRSHAQQAWDRAFRRWGGYPLLGLGVLTSAASADPLLPGDEVYVAGVLVAAALVLQVWWSRTGHRPPAVTGRAVPTTSSAFVLAFVLTWLNPFFADLRGARLLRRRRICCRAASCAPGCSAPR